MTSSFIVFDSAIGPCGLAWCGPSVCAVALPEADEAATWARLARHHRPTDDPPPPIAAVVERITRHLDGASDDLLDVEVDLLGVPDFHRAVYDHLREVPPGETTTYGEVAIALGAPRGAREVGQALGHNPVPIIVPCHRVLAAGGRIGGFSAWGGADIKLRLLAIEGAAPGGQPALF